MDWILFIFIYIVAQLLSVRGNHAGFTAEDEKLSLHLLAYCISPPE